MRKHTLYVTLLLVASLAGALPALAASNTQAALDYLKTQQNTDGGFGSGFDPASTVSSTADALLAIVASGGAPATYAKGANTPVSYLESNAATASTAGDLSKLILAAVAVGKDPRAFGGVDVVAKLEALVGADGRISGEKDTFVSTLLGVLALRSAQRPIPGASLALIKASQQSNGGWAWDGTATTAPDTNTTAFAVEALAAGGESAGSPAVVNALSYYKSIQNADGGWPYQNPSEYGTATDANSTAVTIQALLAAKEDPEAAKWAGSSGNGPIAALEALQNPSGAFAWKADTPDDNLLATVQALPALAGKAFPLTPQAGSGLNPAWFLLLGAVLLAAGGWAVLKRKAR